MFPYILQSTLNVPVKYNHLNDTSNTSISTFKYELKKYFLEQNNNVTHIEDFACINCKLKQTCNGNYLPIFN